MNYCGFNSFKDNIKIENKKYDTSLIPIQQDSLNLLNENEIDYGFNQDITLWGDKTYNLYKSKVKYSPDWAREILTLKTANAIIFIVFTQLHCIEKIKYFKLRGRLNGEFIETKKSYQSGYFGFKIRDSLPFVLGKLKGVKYKIEKDIYSKKSLTVKLHGYLEYDDRFIGKGYDEYTCDYCFTNNKLDLIEINYFRDSSVYTQ